MLKWNKKNDIVLEQWETCTHIVNNKNEYNVETFLPNTPTFATNNVKLTDCYPFVKCL